MASESVKMVGKADESYRLMVRTGFTPLDIFVLGKFAHVIWVARAAGCVIHERYQMRDGVAVSVVA